MKKFNVGLQLYSVREDMAKDFEGTLKKVAEMGYEYVEFAGYFGKSAKEIKEILNRYGLKCISVHQGPAPFFDNGYEIIDYLKELGIEYCVIPWYERKNLEYGTPVWDETIVLPGSEIGQMALFARRKGDVWFVAGICNSAAGAQAAVDLTFLGDGGYRCDMLSDDPASQQALKQHTSETTRAGGLSVGLNVGGGFVARLTPVK